MPFRNEDPVSYAAFVHPETSHKVRACCAACAGEPSYAANLAYQCRLLEKMVESVVDLLPASGISRVGKGSTNSRQITLYLCHVSLGVSQVKIACIFGLSRTAVRQACQTVENRRDDRHLDDILEIIGRLAKDVVLRVEVSDVG